MIDFKATLIKLHDTFPEYDFDTLIKITECIVEDYPIKARKPITDDSPLSSSNFKESKIRNPYEERWLDTSLNK